MGCRCAERRQAISRAVNAAARGDRGALAREIAFVGHSAIEDARSGALRRAAVQRWAQLRGLRR